MSYERAVFRTQTAFPKATHRDLRHGYGQFRSPRLYLQPVASRSKTMQLAPISCADERCVDRRGDGEIWAAESGNATWYLNDIDWKGLETRGDAETLQVEASAPVGRAALIGSVVEADSGTIVEGVGA